MLKRFCAVLLLAIGLAASGAEAEGARPAGYIMAYELKGADAAKGTVVVRDGQELAPKLLMPLYDDDSVFIRDEASRITLSLAQEGTIVVSGKLMRKEIAGEMPSGDGGFDILEQIADILFGHGEDDSLSVLVAKGGDEMTAPLAARGRNHIGKDSRPLLVRWAGGEGPFSVVIDGIGGGKPVSLAVREIDVPLARIGGATFAVVVTDALKRRLRVAFDLRKAVPKAPQEVRARDGSGALEAVWLAAQQNGAWRFEAVRRLRALPQDEVTAGLVAALERGWLPK
ncbi:MAG: hypothetical protein AB7S92_14085 [Parvibaculaceae bacterium]